MEVKITVTINGTPIDEILTHLQEHWQQQQEKVLREEKAEALKKAFGTIIKPKKIKRWEL